MRSALDQQQYGLRMSRSNEKTKVGVLGSARVQDCVLLGFKGSHTGQPSQRETTCAAFFGSLRVQAGGAGVQFRSLNTSLPQILQDNENNMVRASRLHGSLCCVSLRGCLPAMRGAHGDTHLICFIHFFELLCSSVSIALPDPVLQERISWSAAACLPFASSSCALPASKQTQLQRDGSAVLHNKLSVLQLLPKRRTYRVELESELLVRCTAGNTA